MATTEHTINDALAGLLRGTRKAWRDGDVVISENTRRLARSTERPDILVIEPQVSPVCIETEVEPATNVEKEAISRLGRKLDGDGNVILASIALRLPAHLRSKQGDALKDALANAHDMEMALFTGLNANRFPEDGWMTGNLATLSFLIQSASIPPEVIDEATDILAEGVTYASKHLEGAVKTHPGQIEAMCNALHQENSPQTRRMAMTILANAFMFHESLARGEGKLKDVPTLNELKNVRFGLDRDDILKAWRIILQVNYWSIFDIAHRIFVNVPTSYTVGVMEFLHETAQKLIKQRLLRSHDLMGAVFQRLIVDRKFLAAYYTTPASATLLVGLALQPTALPNGKDWASPDNITSFRVADFACGTGTLLSTAYQRISQLHELAGGDAEAIHPKMMATALVGCDVLPAATHLTASMLSGAHPTTKYEDSSILTVAYGKQDNGTIALGSLDLLNPQGRLDFHAITSKALEGTGATEKDTWHTFHDQYFDMVIMNPPFTRDTNHEISEVPNPMFAAFGVSSEVQREMSKASERLTKGTSAHGNAGEASIFLALAHKMLKTDGTLALVMPMTILSGASWEKSRQLLYEHYSDLIFVTVANADEGVMSFSADTGMAECLIVGRKTKSETKRAIFVSLNESPAYPIEGITVAEQIRQLIANQNISKLEDNFMVGSYIRVGKDILGSVVDAPLPASGGWNLVRIADLSLAQSAYQLAIQKRLLLPTQSKTPDILIPITQVKKIGQLGPVHRDVSQKNRDGSVRGPFDRQHIVKNKIPTYPILWAHDANRERTMMFDADTKGVPYVVQTDKEKEAMRIKIEKVLATATHCHANLDFRFNSQSTAMQFTPRKTIGGRAWLSVLLPTPAHEKALVLWSNTSLGLLLFWWHSSRQQAGRGIITKETLHTLPVLDVTALTADQLAEAGKLFDEFCEKPLLPVHEMVNDPVRQALDEQFSTRVLGLPASLFAPLELLRQKLSHEPSIRGGKK